MTNFSLGTLEGNKAAIENLKESLAIQEELLRQKSKPGQTDLKRGKQIAFSHNNLGYVYLQLKMYEDAETHLKTAMEIYEGLEREKGFKKDDFLDLGKCYSNISQLCFEQDDQPHAIIYN